MPTFWDLVFGCINIDIIIILIIVIPYGPYTKNSGPYSGPYGPYAKTKRFEATSDARGHRPEHTEISEWPAYFDGSTAFCALVKTHDSHDSVLHSFH